jgi:outer membrane murein-binding lipoprotein Lpp
VGDRQGIREAGGIHYGRKPREMGNMRNLIFILAPAVALSLVLSGCGKSESEVKKAKDAVRAINGLNPAVSSSQGAALRARQAARHARDTAEGQAWLRHFSTPADNSGDGDGTPEASDNPEVTFTKFEWDMDSNPITYAFEGETNADDTFACKDVTYTVHQGSTFGFSGSIGYSGEGETIAFTSFGMAITMNATLSGGEFNRTSMSCSMSFTADMAKLLDGSEENDEEAVTMDCSNESNKCVVGDETIGCDALKESYASKETQC